MKKISLFFIVFIFLFSINTFAGYRHIQIMVGEKYIRPDAKPYIVAGTTYVPIRFVAEALKVDEVSWDEEKRAAVIVKNGQKLIMPIGKNEIIVNGKINYIGGKISIVDGRTFVPLRIISEALDCTVNWDGQSGTVYIIPSLDDTINKQVTENVIEEEIPIINELQMEEELMWLARIVESEAGGEPFEGKLAVANVVINRKRSDSFPNTIKDVIFDRTHGIQFEPVANNSIYNKPSIESIDAAKKALSGKNNIGEAQFFLNPRKATSFWIVKNRTFYKTISNHDFYY